MKQQESMFWPVVAMLELAVIIVLAVIRPGLGWNWTAIGAIGSAGAAIAAVGIAWWNTVERRRERRVAIQAHANGLRAVLPWVADEAERLSNAGEAGIDARLVWPRSEELFRQVQSIDLAKLLEFDSSTGEHAAVAVQHLRQAHGFLPPEMTLRHGFQRGEQHLRDAAEAATAAAERLEWRCGN